jgi:hypothetical protein
MPLLRQATVIKVAAPSAQVAPRLASNRVSAVHASAAQLPAPVAFYDFRYPGPAAWALTAPEPIRFDAALAWREDDMLSVVPFWTPLNSDGSAKRDPTDSLGGGPVMRVIFGPEDGVVNELAPGTLGASTESGALYCWPDMPQRGEHARAAERAFRCALRFIDVLAAASRN